MYFIETGFSEFYNLFGDEIVTRYVVDTPIQAIHAENKLFGIYISTDRSYTVRRTISMLQNSANGLRDPPIDINHSFSLMKFDMTYFEIDIFLFSEYYTSTNFDFSKFKQVVLKEVPIVTIENFNPVPQVEKFVSFTEMDF